MEPNIACAASPFVRKIRAKPSCSARPATPASYMPSKLAFFQINNFALLSLRANLAPFQSQTNQTICVICHEQWNIQNIIVQLQIVQ